MLLLFAIVQAYVDGINSKTFCFLFWLCLDSVCITVSVILRNLF